MPNLNKILMSKWHLIQDQPLLREIYKEPPIISYKRGKSLKDKKNKNTHLRIAGVMQACHNFKISVQGYVWLWRAMYSCGGLCMAVEGYV